MSMLITVSFCRIGVIPGMKEYTKNIRLNPRDERERQVLEALHIKPPYKEQYIVEMRLKQ
jgi:hypothetical protein